MRPALRAQFADYAAFHAAPGNQACHYVGIPLIMLALFALLARVPLLHADMVRPGVRPCCCIRTSIVWSREAG